MEWQLFVIGGPGEKVQAVICACDCKSVRLSAFAVGWHFGDSTYSRIQLSLWDGEIVFGDQAMAVIRLPM